MMMLESPTLSQGHKPNQGSNWSRETPYVTTPYATVRPQSCHSYAQLRHNHATDVTSILESRHSYATLKPHSHRSDMTLEAIYS